MTGVLLDHVHKDEPHVGVTEFRFGTMHSKATLTLANT